MEEQELLSSHVQIRGRDLPGAINVLPVGLSEVLAKRESREFHVEQNSTSSTFSTGALTEHSFFTSEKSFSTLSNNFASSGILPLQPSQALESPSQLSFQQNLFDRQSILLQEQQKLSREEEHGEEIKQESLKSTLQSAILDIEEHIDGTEYEANKENKYPLHIKKEFFLVFLDDEKNIDFQNQSNPGEEEVAKRFKFPHEFKGRPLSQPEYQAIPSNSLDLPEVGLGSKKVYDDNAIEESSIFNEDYTSKNQEKSCVNGILIEENFSSSCQRMEQKIVTKDSITVMDKVMTPCAEFDSNSLKRRNPRQMFTDSSFYSPKFHPSVADQVEMAHRLSSSLYEDGNKMSKGQEMYLKRMKKSGVDLTELEELPHHDKVPNLKLVMNPEGKLHDWTDVPEDELPELQQIVSGGPSLVIAHNVVENLQTCKGRGGELFAKRRKKADKWVVDESSIGSTAPSQFADHFLQQQSFQQQQFQMQQQQEYQEQLERQNKANEHERFERQQLQEEQQMIFRQQQMQKQQQSLEIRQMNASKKQSEVDLPPDFKPYSLKGRSFTPTFDTSIHNVQGINVWANKAPKPFGTFSTLPRTTTPSHARTTFEERPQQPIEVPQVAICPATPQVTDEELYKVETNKSVQQVTSSSMIEKNEVGHREDLEEQKRREYEAWFKSQEREQQLLEYDCSVKYVEKQVDQQHQEHYVTRKEQNFQQQEIFSTSLSTSKGVSIGATIQEEPMESSKHGIVEPHLPMVATPEPDIPKPSAQLQQLLQQEQERLLRQKQQEHNEFIRQQEEERLQQEDLMRQQQEQVLAQQEEERQIKQKQERQQLQEQERLQQQEHELFLKQEQEQLLRQEQEQQEQLLRQKQQEQLLRQEQQQQEQLLRHQQQEQLLRQEHQQQEQLLRQQQQEQLLREEQEEWLLRKQQEQQQQQQQVETHHQQHQKTELHHSELSMQMKTGGLVFRKEAKDTQIEDYVGSLRPTTTGAIIRTEGDVFYTQAPSYEEPDGQEPFFSEVELRKTSTGGKKDLRQSGVFVGIFGENNALVNSSEAFDYEKHSVRSLVDHFSKTKPREQPSEIVQHQATQAPPLSYLREQAKEKQFHFQEKGKQIQEESSGEKKLEDAKLQEMMLKRRNSLKDYLLMEFNEGTSSSFSNHSAHQLLDPSTILKVDGSVVDGPGLKTRSKDGEGQERLAETDKWDNHNAIARGWRTIEDFYHPVTFRRIYGVCKQQVNLKTTASAPQLASSPIHDNEYEEKTIYKQV